MKDFDLGTKGLNAGEEHELNSFPSWQDKVCSNEQNCPLSVVNIKEGIAANLGDHAGQGDSQNPSKIVVDTPSLQEIRDGLAGKDIATLQVKNDDGCQTLIIKLRFGDTIGALRKFIDMHRLSGSPYEIRTAFPNKSYDDTSQTLQEAGLVPNAVLMLRKEKVGTAYSKK